MVQPDGATFTPFSINPSTQSISHDPNYFTAANYDKYDNTGYLQTMDDNNRAEVYKAWRYGGFLC